MELLRLLVGELVRNVHVVVVRLVLSKWHVLAYGLILTALTGVLLLSAHLIY